ncbi:HelD family protein [Jatrophihabitans fulvus]
MDQTDTPADTDAGTDATAAEVALEQRHLTRLYALRDRLLGEAQQSLSRTARSGTVGNPGARAERDAFMRLYGQRVRALEAVETRMCFGRLDLDDGQRRYIGRIGLSDTDDAGERKELLVDWRAPAAEPFYQATAARPGGVLRRRQLSTANRRVTGIQDEVLDLEGFERAGVDGSHVVVGEGALFASLDAARGPRMRDIVATIQADQDAVIRAPLAGVLVVQGGPGTGKTAVALHRTAFLLYANRERIARSGVLLVGPNRVFLRYIDQVLPALGEADAVVMATPGELFHGVVATAVESPEVVALKGDVRMARVIAEAVRRRQRLVNTGRPLDIEGTVIRLQPRYVREAREAARRSRNPHNVARRTFVQVVMRHLLRALASARNVDVDDDTRPGLLTELYAARDVRRELNLCWPPLRPEKLLRDLYADPERLAEAAPRMSRDDRQLLRRERTAPWSAADVPLLDEAAELLGVDETAESNAASARAEADRRAEVEYAKQVQDTFGGAAYGTAEQLASRYAGSGEVRSVAEQAETDRGWAYGHVVVDEAQELSPMAWRLLMRRCPSRSFTVVGDVAQTGSAAGASAWGEVLEPHVGDRWRLSELTVNYRTPQQVMDLAAAVLAAAGSSVKAPTSARVGRHEPDFTRVRANELAGAVSDAAAAAWHESRPGTVAVITPAAAHDAVAAAVAAALPDGVVTADSDALGSPVSVLTVAGAKGLEFDAVVLVEPGAIVDESSRGLNDLYVALTRPTQRLHVVHSGDLPAGMR